MLELETARVHFQHSAYNNPSNFLSHHTTMTETKREEEMAEEYINFLSLHSVPKAMTAGSHPGRLDTTVCH